jgi:hypothetical protein
MWAWIKAKIAALWDQIKRIVRPNAGGGPGEE